MKRKREDKVSKPTESTRTTKVAKVEKVAKVIMPPKYDPLSSKNHTDYIKSTRSQKCWEKRNS
jgi:hypothetical protein